MSPLYRLQSTFLDEKLLEGFTKNLYHFKLLVNICVCVYLTFKDYF